MYNITITYIHIHDDISFIGSSYFYVYDKKDYFQGIPVSTVLPFWHQILQEQMSQLFIGSDIILTDSVYIENIVDMLQNEKEKDNGIKCRYNSWIKKHQYYPQTDIKLTYSDLEYKLKYDLEHRNKQYIPAFNSTFRSLI